ncbi:unnamed protein product [Ixodes persulcatus]
MKSLRWCPSSKEQLHEAEEKIFSYMKKKRESRYVDVGRFGDSPSTCRLWTVTMKPDEDCNANGQTRLPLVMLHGLGCGAALWVMNLESLSRDRVVHTVDLLGFGRSSRPSLGPDAALIEQQLVFSVEAWRQQMSLERFILLGHSLGGFLASSYSLQYPQHVAHLVLEDPWGFPVYDPARPRSKRLPVWSTPLQACFNYVNVLSALRALGHLGPPVMQKALSGADAHFGHFVKDSTAIPNYVYHCNVRRPTGEEAFRNLSVHFGWTKHPMVERFLNLDPKVPVTFLYGDRTFITRSPAKYIKKNRSAGYVDIQVLKECGHNVHMDQPDQFNDIVNKVCDLADSQEKLEGDQPTDLVPEE